MKSLESEILSVLAMLRRHINPMESPAYRLPPELFPLVAGLLESDTDLVHATHISHHWRNTLHSHPSLWSHLDFEDIGRALTFLERSKSASFRVTLVGDSPVFPLIEPLYPHTTCIVTLSLIDCASQKELLIQPMPSLKRFEIIGDPLDPGEPPVDGVILSLPSSISLAFHNTHPILLHVPRLTHFKFLYSVPENDPTMVERFFDFLYNCPLLEDFEV